MKLFIKYFLCDITKENTLEIIVWMSCTYEQSCDPYWERNVEFLWARVAQVANYLMDSFEYTDHCQLFYSRHMDSLQIPAKTEYEVFHTIPWAKWIIPKRKL